MTNRIYKFPKSVRAALVLLFQWVKCYFVSYCVGEVSHETIWTY